MISSLTSHYAGRFSRAVRVLLLLMVVMEIVVVIVMMLRELIHRIGSLTQHCTVLKGDLVGIDAVVVGLARCRGVHHSLRVKM